jgi:hypothetical protein
MFTVSKLHIVFIICLIFCLCFISSLPHQDSACSLNPLDLQRSSPTSLILTPTHFPKLPARLWCSQVQVISVGVTIALCSHFHFLARETITVINFPPETKVPKGKGWFILMVLLTPSTIPCRETISKGNWFQESLQTAKLADGQVP